MWFVEPGDQSHVNLMNWPCSGWAPPGWVHCASATFLTSWSAQLLPGQKCLELIKSCKRQTLSESDLFCRQKLWPAGTFFDLPPLRDVLPPPPNQFELEKNFSNSISTYSIQHWNLIIGMTYSFYLHTCGVSFCTVPAILNFVRLFVYL